MKQKQSAFRNKESANSKKNPPQASYMKKTRTASGLKNKQAKYNS